MSSLARVEAHAPIPEPVLDQAIRWRVRLESDRATSSEQAACAAWRAADALHERAWTQLCAIDDEFKPLPQTPGRLMLDVLSAAQQASAQAQRRRALKLLALGGVGLSGVMVSQQLPWQRDWARYRARYTTALGERRSFELADGTQLLLNTETAADVQFTPGKRLIVLHQGEILIRTGADAAQPAKRPFWVETPEARLQAIGTRFVVYRQDDRALLHVTEGVVAAQGRAGGEVLMVDAGQRAQIASTAARRIDYATGHDGSDTGLDPTAWADGVLVAKQVRLADFAAELVRYTGGWLDCDPAVANLRVSGVFQLDDPRQILQNLSRSLPVRVERRWRYWVRLAPA